MEALPLASLVRRRWSWLVLVLAAGLSAVLAVRLFPRAFPVVSLDIHMDRAHALRAARTLATVQHWGPHDAVREAASFAGDGAAQSFVELEGGGKSAFTALLHDDLYAPYKWQVRLFKESETNQTIVAFKPGGDPYGFEETLREKDPGAALSSDAARKIAEGSAAGAPWNLPLARFNFIEKSQVTRPGGRVDHTFVYERPDLHLGEGRLRLELVVSGDRLTGLTHFIKIPEAFTRRYEQMRSANNAIAAGASIAMVLLYLLAGCGGGFAYLLRRRAALWRQPLAWAGVIVALQILAEFNAWPLAWLNYDTALSRSGFISERLVSILANNLVLGFVFFVSFLAAEGLSRAAFPHHPQLWKLWSRDAAATPETLGRTLGGFLLAIVGVLYVSTFYYFALRKLGWWTPSEALTDPDSLAHYWPWLTPFARAAQAGFWEESLFRAVPLAGAALLGSRFGRRRWWIAGAFVLQALVFASAHANYPGQPAYSRLVELLVPSCIFAALYLRFGLLPSILLHFGYDVTLMSLPLFAASASGIWVDRALVALFSLTPLWIVLWRRGQSGAWHPLSDTLRNAAWQPPEIAPRPAARPDAPAARASISRRLRFGLVCSGVLGVILWASLSHFALLGPPMTIGRTDAIARARAELERRSVKLPPSFRADAGVPDRPWTIDRFAWQTVGPKGYAALLGLYVPEARWIVRFATFTGDVVERAEEWNVFLNGDGTVNRFIHKLPEARAGATLSEADARQRVRAFVREHWKLDPEQLTEVSATSAKRPNRLDWAFVFKDPAVKSLAPGEARLQVELSGDEITDAFRFTFVPEDWERADRALQSRFGIGRAVKGVSIAVLVLCGLGFGIAAWSRKRFSARIALKSFGVLFVIPLIAAVNHWPAARMGFSTAQPLPLQMLMATVGPFVGILIAAAAFALLAGYVARWLQPPVQPERDACLAGLGLGLAVAGGLACAALFRVSAAPPWPSLGLLGTYSSWVVSVLTPVNQLVSQTIVLLFLFGLLNRLGRRRRVVCWILAFLAGAVVLLPWGSITFASWLGSTAIAALVFALAYALVLHRDLTLVPLVSAATSALNALGNGLSNAYPSALPEALVASLVSLAVGWFLLRLLRQLASSAPLEPPSGT